MAASFGLPCTPQLIGTSTYRWRWYADLVAFMWTGCVAGIAYWAEVHRARPKLRVIDVTTLSSSQVTP